MKHDKHKAKNSANYKKKHGISPGKSEDKTQRKVKEHQHGGSAVDLHTQAQALAEIRESLIIEKQHEIRKEYARRKVESNWTKYDDFVVDDEREAEVSSEPRGEDFQKLAAKSDDASSQLRMKDEVWWDGDDQQDETETEIGELFKVDYVDLARRLKCIPLHERLGISTKYFDEDLLNRINEDAAENAKSYQEILAAENAQDLDNPASSDTTDNQTRGLSEPTISASSKNSCKIDRLQEVIVKDNNEQICHDASRTGSDREHCARDMEQTESQVSNDRATTVSDSSCSHPDSQSSTSGSLATPSNKSTLSADVKEPASELQTKPDEEENLEEWLEDILDD
eukprot:XP_001197910.1 PREDICTED: cell death regulator Aven [Strongylocentrotus purpuratus]